MSHREILQALSGLLLGMFVATVSSTIVSTALPTILADIGGGQSAYTWIVTASLLALTATTPIWGKLSDMVSKKFLVQLALVLYIGSSVVAALAQNARTLIACRAVQGVGAGGLTALAQIIMAAMVPARQRGRYTGYLGAAYAIATVGGPLIGGVLTDTSWLGWRWCFYVVIPFSLIAMVVLHRTIHLPVIRRGAARVDWLGSLLVAASACLLMVWVTLAGNDYPWISWRSGGILAGVVVLTLSFVLVESRAGDPIVPLRLFRDPVITLASVSVFFVGVAMFAGTIFMNQFFQLARDQTPTMAGIMTIPLVAGLLLASMLSGRIITATGHLKIFLVVGGVFIAVGAAGLGLTRVQTPYWQIAGVSALFGMGVGLLFQNLVLVAQNRVGMRALGAASSLVAFSRSLGGAVGLAALGAVLGNRVASDEAGRAGRAGIPDLARLSTPVREIVEAAYGHGVADVFLCVAVCAVLAMVLVVFIRVRCGRFWSKPSPSVRGQPRSATDSTRKPISDR
jgi:EmrB/QacA subfamily drug resistance transporter